MKQAKLAPGNNVLDIVMVFGGSKIIVPQDWDVKVRCLQYSVAFPINGLNHRKFKRYVTNLDYKRHSYIWRRRTDKL
jgi:predicted membrane protein